MGREETQLVREGLALLAISCEALRIRVLQPIIALGSGFLIVNMQSDSRGCSTYRARSIKAAGR